jgi:hypothetical protein
MVSSKDFETANERGRQLRRRAPAAVNVRYDRKSGRVIVVLSSGVDISFSPKAVEGLENSTPSQLEHIEITPSGLGIHFPKLDADLYLPALLEGVMGSRKWMASRLGAMGGKSSSEVKRRASRVNGLLGGRPKKAASG